MCDRKTAQTDSPNIGDFLLLIVCHVAIDRPSTNHQRSRNASALRLLPSSSSRRISKLKGTTGASCFLDHWSAGISRAQSQQCRAPLVRSFREHEPSRWEGYSKDNARGISGTLCLPCRLLEAFLITKTQKWDQDGSWRLLRTGIAPVIHHKLI